MRVPVLPLVLLLALAGRPDGVAAQMPRVPEPCTSDLTCIEMFSTARAADASGAVTIGRPWSPFGVSVTPEGTHVHELVLHLSGLPEPSELGAYSTYVAWATPLELDPVVRLGEVRNGETRLGSVAFNKYLVMISAEASADVAEREGPLVLRGRSPSSRMEAHDLMTLAPAAEEVGDGPAGHRHDGGWTMPPMYEGVPEMAGMMGVQPKVSPLDVVGRGPISEVSPREVVSLPHGGTLDLTAGFVRKRVGERDLVMFAFNGQHPGPLIRVDQGATIFVNFTNDTPFPTAVHWHGLRLDNRFDGVPHLTQEPVESGETFRYEIRFPDAGIYWYHPHHREDVQQELGLAGNMLVEPTAEGYYGPVNRAEVLMLDDLLLGEEELVPFGDESANYMLMGRFGNVFLTNGEPEYRLEVDRGEVVRFFLTNASNTRTFNLSLVRAADPGTRSGPDARAPEPLPLKVVGSDVGKFEREAWARSAVLAPAERYVVEVRFPEAGAYELRNHVQGINHRMGVFLEEVSTLGTVEVGTRDAAPDHGGSFETLRDNAEVVRDIDRYRPAFARTPDHELVLTLAVDSLPLSIEQSMRYDWLYFNPVEWTGTMPMMNWATTGREVRWILRDARTGAENDDVSWRFRVGDVVKIRLHNDRTAFHAMQHPLHIHGQRFLVLEQDGVRNTNLVWKDTVLLPTGSTTDILLELSNPGRWMVHCHIAEHLESGMKFVIDVEGNRP